MSQQLFFHTPFIPSKTSIPKRRSRVTIAAIVNDGLVKFGASKCDHKDNFSRKIGREIALNRAANTDTAIGVVSIPQETNFIQWFNDTASILASEILRGQLPVDKPI